MIIRILVLIIVFLPTYLICQETSEQKSVSVEAGFFLSQEQELESLEYSDHPSLQKNHYNLELSLNYHLNNNIEIGLIGCMGFNKNGSCSNYYGISRSFDSKSYDFGISTKFDLMEYKIIKLYFEPYLHYRLVNQLYILNCCDPNLMCATLSASRNIILLGQNIRFGGSVALYNNLRLNIFISNDIIAREVIDNKYSITYPTYTWQFLYDDIITGIELRYKFNNK